MSRDLSQDSTWYQVICYEMKRHKETMSDAIGWEWKSQSSYGPPPEKYPQTEWLHRTLDRASVTSLDGDFILWTHKRVYVPMAYYYYISCISLRRGPENKGYNSSMADASRTRQTKKPKTT